jgi:hypothetical protein
MKRLLVVLAVTALVAATMMGTAEAKGKKKAGKKDRSRPEKRQRVKPEPKVIWNVPGNFATIKAAMDSEQVEDGSTILLAAGEHVGAYVTKSVTIKGEKDAVINSGPANEYGIQQGLVFIEGSEGARVSHIEFNVDLAILNGDSSKTNGAPVDNVRIEHCTFNDTVQAITNRGGNGWKISHNTINNICIKAFTVRTPSGTVKYYGGGLGIQIGDRNGGTSNNNLISHNNIIGTLKVAEGDKGGYSRTGIWVLADFAGDRFQGATEITGNKIIKNKVQLVSSNPELVEIVAFGMTDSRTLPDNEIIHDNVIGFNDFKGTVQQIVLSPEDLGESNHIARNNGEKRGKHRKKKAHPSKYRIDRKHKHKK